MNRIAIVVRDDAYDKVLTPLAFAFTAAASNTEVDMLFVNWAVRLLSEKGVPGESSHPEADEWLRAQVAKAGLPPNVRDILKALKATGKVRFYACSLASQIFEVAKEDLIPEAEGIVGAGWFLEEKANGNHTQYF
jgi:peroxiredoxin family protein